MSWGGRTLTEDVRGEMDRPDGPRDLRWAGAAPGVAEEVGGARPPCVVTGPGAEVDVVHWAHPGTWA